MCYHSTSVIALLLCDFGSRDMRNVKQKEGTGKTAPRRIGTDCSHVRKLVSEHMRRHAHRHACRPACRRVCTHLSCRRESTWLDMCVDIGVEVSGTCIHACVDNM